MIKIGTTKGKKDWKMYNISSKGNMNILNTKLNGIEIILYI